MPFFYETSVLSAIATLNFKIRKINMLHLKKDKLKRTIF